MFEINRDLMGILTRLVPVCATPECKAYLVGGFVRDWLVGRENSDLDIAVSGDSLAVAQEAAELVDGRYVMLDEGNRVGRVVVPGEDEPWHIDITSHEGNIELDLLRRDFTVNAMGLDLAAFVAGEEVLLDPSGGEEDLRKCLLRQVSDRVYKHDPSRLLRAVRLSRELGLEIESITEETILLNSALVQSVPGEKVREELLRVLALPFADASLRTMDRLGLLCPIIPEISDMKGVEQPREHYWDVFDHSMESVAALEFLLRQNDWVYGRKDLRSEVPWDEETASYFGQEVSVGGSRRTMLKVGMLLHDIAKPKDRSQEDGGRIRFLGHTKDGALMAAAILDRLRFSAREIKYVEKVIYHHLHPAQMSNAGLPTTRAVYRFFRDTDGMGLDVLYLALADYLAVAGPRVDEQEWHMHINQVKYIIEIHDKQEKEIMPIRLLTGEDLMREFSLSPGRAVGRLLGLIREAQAAGEIRTRDEALRYVRNELGSGACCAA